MLRAMTAGAVCLVMGCASAMRLSHRSLALRSMHAALARMETYCRCLRMTPDEIVKASMTFLPAENRGEVMEKTEKLPFTKEERELVKAACDALYDASREAQVQCISFAEQRFCELLKSAQEKQSRDAGLYASLGFFGGLCVFLMCM